MKIFLKNLIISNKAPFQNLSINFERNGVGVLSGINGQGKTTILSHITDSFFELAKIGFSKLRKNEAYYRISSPLHALDFARPSFVYIRYILLKEESEENIDFIFASKVSTLEDYNLVINLENKIDFNSNIKPALDSLDHCKTFSPNVNQEMAEKIFLNNICTHFPAYRYEDPGYLGKSSKINLEFTNKSFTHGFLKNPIEVVSGLDDLVNWLMDVLLDLQYDAESRQLQQNINSLITNALSGKFNSSLRIGVGPRNYRGSRVQILNAVTKKMVYPSLFGLSSGESSLLCLFGEILKQADTNRMNIPLQDISGIVLVDEVTKHLHIKLEKEILPKLIALFPNVQFIVSSHSPFFNLGLAEILPHRSKIIDIKTGIAIPPSGDPQYNEVYQLMITENTRFKEKFDELKRRLRDGYDLQIITEGKNTEHIVKAIQMKAPELSEKILVVPGAESKSGCQQLKNSYEIMSKAHSTNKFLFVWDYDSANMITNLIESNTFFKFCFDKNTDNSKTDKGIENLYSEELFTKDLYDNKETPIQYGGKKTEEIFNKDKFLEKVKRLNETHYFDNYDTLIQKIEGILTSQDANP